MELIYRKATIKDIKILTQKRIQVLRAANKLNDTIDMSVVEQNSYDYYKAYLKDESHVAYLVFDRDIAVGTGGICFYKVMPTYHNPTGKRSYIMNMYTAPGYRRMGIAYKTLDLLVLASKERGVSHICLEATDMGRPLYMKYGFTEMDSEMELIEQ